MKSYDRSNCRLTRRAVLNSGIAALAAANSASTFAQQQTSRNRGTTDDPPFKNPSNRPTSRLAWEWESTRAGCMGPRTKGREVGRQDRQLVGRCEYGSAPGERDVFRRSPNPDRRKNRQGCWRALFTSFNDTRKQGKGGYRKGEKIAIKVNSNQDRPGAWRFGAGMNSPQVIYSLVNQLITVAGVPVRTSRSLMRHDTSATPSSTKSAPTQTRTSRP